MHTMAGLMNGWRVEFHLDMQSIGEQVYVDPPRPDNNIVRIPDAPGLGLTPNFDKLKESRVAQPA
jgi:L-alanine-DL-glutamate epimerase-like enolase superfamily enzyme